MCYKCNKRKIIPNNNTKIIPGKTRKIDYRCRKHNQSCCHNLFGHYPSVERKTNCCPQHHRIPPYHNVYIRCDCIDY